MVVGKRYPCLHPDPRAFSFPFFLFSPLVPLRWGVSKQPTAGWGFCRWPKANPPHRQGMTQRTRIDGIPEIYKHRNIPSVKENNWNKWTMFAREQMGKSGTDEYTYITNSKGVIFNPQIWKSLLLWTEWAKIWKTARATEPFETNPIVVNS